MPNTTSALAIGAGPRAPPADHRRGGGRRRIHYGRQRHRQDGRERSRDDRFTREYGDYGGEPCDAPPQGAAPAPGFKPTDISPWQTARPAGVCIPWSEKQKELPPIQRHEEMVERIWNEIEGLGNMFIYQVLVSF